MIGTLGGKFAANRRRAQGMTEYIIIVALVAIALITIVSLFGNKIKFLFTGSVKSLDEGKVYDPKALGDSDVKDKLGEDDANLENQKKGHTLKNFGQGSNGD